MVITLEEKDCNAIEAVFNDMTSYKAIIAEVAMGNENISIKDLKIYEEYKNLAKRWREVSDEVISRVTDGKFNGEDIDWKLDFKTRELTIRGV